MSLVLKQRCWDLVPDMDLGMSMAMARQTTYTDMEEFITSTR